MALQASIRDHSSASLNEEAPPWGGWPAGSRFVAVCLYMVRVIEAERERERERERMGVRDGGGEGEVIRASKSCSWFGHQPYLSRADGWKAVEDFVCVARTSSHSFLKRRCYAHPLVSVRFRRIPTPCGDALAHTRQAIERAGANCN